MPGMKHASFTSHLQLQLFSVLLKPYQWCLAFCMLLILNPVVAAVVSCNVAMHSMHIKMYFAQLLCCPALCFAAAQLLVVRDSQASAALFTTFLPHTVLPCIVTVLAGLPAFPALCVLPAALLHHNASDVRLPFAAAAAIAAYLSVYLLAGGSSSTVLQHQLGATWCQQLAVPPMGLVSVDKLAALLRLFKYRLGANGPPMLEAVEGVACR